MRRVLQGIINLLLIWSWLIAKKFSKHLYYRKGLSNFHKLILTFFKTEIIHLKRKIAFYQNYKHFEDSKFLEDLNITDFSLNTDATNENYNFITDKFVNIVNRHAPLKKKTLRNNQAPFLTKELRKEIYTRSKINNKCNRTPTEEIKTICVSPRRKAIKA